MAFILLFVGILLLVSAIRNTQSDLALLFKTDFTGPGNFIYWILALLVIGAIGYSEKLKPLSDGLLVLVILALFLTRGRPDGTGGGFFKQFTTAINTTKSGGGSTVGGGLVPPVSISL